MTRKPPPRGEDAPGNRQAGNRKERLADALRANLHRRKAQARGRETTPGGAAELAGTPPREPGRG